jgi:DNA-binding transcriptional ArsR family regulator
MRTARATAAAVDEAFSALADPTRRAVLALLRGGPRPAGEIAAAFPISRPAISKHLRRLRRVRLVEERREGRNRYYRLNPAPLEAIDAWLNDYRVFWRANLAQLKSFVEAKAPARRGPRARSRRS